MKLFAALFAILVTCLTIFIFSTYRDTHSIKRLILHSTDDVVHLFPQDKQGVECLLETAIENARDHLERIYQVKANKRTFKNTVEAFDIVLNRFNITSAALATMMYASPDEGIRTAAQQAVLKLQEFSVDHFSHNPQLYKSFVEYEELLKQPNAEHLNDVEQYAFNEFMKDFERHGLKLPLEKQEQIKKIQKEIAEHALQFDVNINSSNITTQVNKEGLLGLDEDFIKSLKKTESGKYILGTDYPTNVQVLDNCKVAATRKAQYQAFFKRGYPANEQELKTVIRLRDELAHLLGYESYAHYDIAHQMAKTPAAVQQFLDDIIKRAQVKSAQELSILKKHLPESVKLAPDGSIYPWDLSFIRNQYKKKHLAIDEDLISEYFPLEVTLPALFSIYEQFFGLCFKALEGVKLWHEDVRVLAVYKNGIYLGCLILDLFPRPFKYTHAGELPIVPALKKANGQRYQAATVVLANFPKPHGEKPALLKRNDVITFFHEAGHALHDLLGATQLASVTGTSVKGDFLEMPSQMLEEWMWDPEIIKKVSSHYKTKEPLPDDLIEKIVALKHFESGEQTVRQAYFATVCLAYFSQGPDKDVQKIWKDFHKSLRKDIYFDESNKGYCSFTHLMGYGAKYYGYLWSKVFALDLFDYIKPYGLLNRTIGERYTQEVIGHGGSKDPGQLLENFLGRKPNANAFFKDLGL